MRTIYTVYYENEDEEDMPEPPAARAGRRYGNGAAEEDDGD